MGRKAPFFDGKKNYWKAKMQNLLIIPRKRVHKIQAGRANPFRCKQQWGILIIAPAGPECTIAGPFLTSGQ